MTDATDFLARALAAKASADAALSVIDRELERLASVVQAANRAYASAPTVKAIMNADLVRQARAGQDPIASASIRELRNQSELLEKQVAKMRKFYGAACQKRDEIKLLVDTAAELVREAQVAVDEENR